MRPLLVGGVGENRSDIIGDGMEGEEDVDSTSEFLILEQVPGARNNDGAATASTGVGAARR